MGIRKLDDNVYKQLQHSAAKHGISMEKKAREILTQAVSASSPISKVFQKYFASKNGIDLDIPNQRNPHHPMGFDE